MEQNYEKNKNLTYKTDEKSLLEELKLAIGDYFNCEFVEGNGFTIMQLVNGQRFKLSLEEV